MTNGELKENLRTLAGGKIKAAIMTAIEEDDELREIVINMTGDELGELTVDFEDEGSKVLSEALGELWGMIGKKESEEVFSGLKK